MRRGDLRSELLLTGELVAQDAVLLIVPNANIWPVTVRWIETDGSEVAEGDVIVEFDNSQLANNLEELERGALEAANQLTSLRATVRGEEIEVELAWERARAALEKARLDADVPPSLLSEQEYEERRLDLERAQLEHDQAAEALELERASSRARLEKQRLELVKAERAAARAREGIELLTLEAARDGILLVSENEDEGRPYQSGDTTWPGQTIARLPELSSMVVEAQLFDVDDGRVEAGMPVSAVVDAFPEAPLSGEVIEVDAIANETSRHSLRRFFRTTVRVEGLDLERMRPGMSVKVIVEQIEEDVLLVPRRALGWQAGTGQSSVVAALEDGRLHPVVIAACDRAVCAVVQGLEEGQQLSTYPGFSIWETEK